MTTARDHLSKADTVTIAAIEERVPTLVQARILIYRFHAMIRKRTEAELDPWMTEAAARVLLTEADSVGIPKSAGR